MSREEAEAMILGIEDARDVYINGDESTKELLLMIAMLPAERKRLLLNKLEVEGR